jgi:hypothetical protein
MEFPIDAILRGERHFIGMMALRQDHAYSEGPLVIATSRPGQARVGLNASPGQLTTEEQAEPQISSVGTRNLIGHPQSILRLGCFGCLTRRNIPASHPRL